MRDINEATTKWGKYNEWVSINELCGGVPAGEAEW
jgi:hypothetical protein